MIDFRDKLKQNPFILAPMDMVTDICFRELAEECGASFSVTELTSIESLIRGHSPEYRTSRGKLKFNVVQIFGNDLESFKIAAKMLDKDLDCDVIDINFGCPSTSVTGNNAGSILLKDPENVYEIVKTVVENTSKPVTAKIRLGYTSLTYLDIAKEIERAGASLLTVHGRTAKQKYSGEANWDAIKEIYEAVSIPVIGNGDVRNPEIDVEKIGVFCDGLMIGRAAIGNPFIFTEFLEYYKNKKLMGWDRRVVQKDLFKTYLKKLENYDFSTKNIKIQTQSMWFMKGISGAKNLRSRIAQEKDIDVILKYVDEF